MYRQEYDRGDHAVVRNVSSLVQKAVADWSEKMGVLERTPIGDNYDVSQHSSILRVVCVPTVPYVPLGAATAMQANGLRAAASYSELVAWLPDGQPPT